MAIALGMDKLAIGPPYKIGGNLNIPINRCVNSGKPLKAEKPLFWGVQKAIFGPPPYFRPILPLF
jgi:hypothetical protein